VTGIIRSHEVRQGGQPNAIFLVVHTDHTQTVMPLNITIYAQRYADLLSNYPSLICHRRYSPPQIMLTKEATKAHSYVPTSCPFALKDSSSDRPDSH